MKKSMKTIAITNQKGGVGKTTTAQSLASILGDRNKDVLAIDCDPQADLTYSSGVGNAPYGLFDVMAGVCGVMDAIIPCRHYDLLSADNRLAGIASTQGVEPNILKESLADGLLYDYCIIDSPPAQNSLIVNVLTAADYAIIPIEPSPYAVKGLTETLDTIRVIKKATNPNLEIAGVLLIKYSDRTVLNRSIADIIREYASKTDIRVFTATIRDGISVRESQMERKCLIDYARNSKPCIDYRGFTTEVLKILEGDENGRKKV